MTDGERLLWSRLRRKQLHNVQFYRQRPLGRYIVDFYAPAVNLIIEVDGGQHFEEDHIEKDKKRDEFFASLNTMVLRFDNLQVLQSLDDVVDVIFEKVAHWLA